MPNKAEQGSTIERLASVSIEGNAAGRLAAHCLNSQGSVYSRASFDVARALALEEGSANDT